MLAKQKKHAFPLAIDGGEPVRTSPLPYGRQEIHQGDIDAVVATLSSPWLTTGPKVREFEAKFCEVTGARFAVAVSNGTAALHTALFAIGIKPEDEVIVPAMTFAATSNAALYLGAKPVFCDVDPNTLLIDPNLIEKKITKNTKAILCVDYAGQSCEYSQLRALADKHDLWLIADSCHGLGGKYRSQTLGTLADITAFSFHPVKQITTGEGGMLATNNPDLAKRMKLFRNHGITTEAFEREKKGTWQYEMVELGYNYRICDIQCALGVSQLNHLNDFIKRRRQIAALYDSKLKGMTALSPLKVDAPEEHAYHLYVVRIDPSQWTVDRNRIFDALRAEGILVNVHYIPVHLHPYYQTKLGTKKGLCPQAEKAADEILTLPLFPAMTSKDVEDVIAAINKVFYAYGK